MEGILPSKMDSPRPTSATKRGRSLRDSPVQRAHPDFRLGVNLCLVQTWQTSPNPPQKQMDRGPERYRYTCDNVRKKRPNRLREAAEVAQSRASDLL